MLIYKATNKIDGKMYVGQTSLTLESRIKAHKNGSYKKGYFGLAIKKYGIDNFIFEQIDLAESMEELNLKEQKWIKELNTLVPNGYNLTTGGTQGGRCSSITKERMSARQKEVLRRPLSEETKQKISKTLTGRKLEPFTKEHREKISNALVGIVRKPHSPKWIENHIARITGRKCSEETKEKRRNNNKNSQKLFSPETGRVYGSINMAAKEHGISRSGIYQLIKGKLNFLRDKNTKQKLTFRRVE